MHLYTKTSAFSAPYLDKKGENDAGKEGSIKYDYILNKLRLINYVDEEHGVLVIEDIVEKCKGIFSEYPVHYCFLFGSYAKGHAVDNSDIDLLISSDISGLKYYEFVEKLRSALHKKVDVLSVEQLKGNYELTCEILRDGIKIYG